MIKLSKASVGSEELVALEEVFTKTVNFGLGVHVSAFEKALAEFMATQNEVICVNTGTAALHIALAALTFPEGSEVLVPSITFVASYSAISAAGLVPVSCEVFFPNCHIDIDDARKRVTSKTVAIMPVAYSGSDFEREALYALAHEHNLRVIEDDAHAFGSQTQNGKIFGSEGDIVCFSFDGIKNITCGEGGAVVTGDKELAKRIRVIRALGIEQDVALRYSGQRAWEYDIKVQGYRYHMSNINAAIGLAQLKKLPQFHYRRNLLRESYEGEIEATFQNIVTPTQNGKKTDCYHIFSCLLPPGKQRAAVRTYMREHGVESGFHYVPNHTHTLYRSNYPLPKAEELGDRLISLPLHPDLEPESIPFIVSVFEQALKHG